MFKQQKYDINYNNDIFYILKKNKGKVSYIKEGKYGVEIGFSIEGDPICLRVPDPDILFGFSDSILKQFVN